MHDAARQIGRGAGAGQLSRRTVELAAHFGLDQLFDAVAQRLQARCDRGNQGGGAAAAAQPHQIGHLGTQHALRSAVQRIGRRGRHCRRIDRLPQPGKAEQLPRRHKGAGDIGDAGAQFFGQFEGRRKAGAVDQFIGQVGRHQFAAQAVMQDRIAVRALHGSRERGDQISFQQRIIHHRAGHQHVIGGHLGIGHHHRQFRPGQAFASLRTLGQHVIAGQAFHLAVQSNTAFQSLDQPLEHWHGGCTAGFRQADGLRLQAVVAQHQFRNVVGH